MSGVSERSRGRILNFFRELFYSRVGLTAVEKRRREDRFYSYLCELNDPENTDTDQTGGSP